MFNDLSILVRGLSDFLVAEALGLCWVESANSSLSGVVSAKFDVLDKLPSTIVFKLLHVWSISVFLEVLGSGSEDSQSTGLEGKEHLLED